jgi:hypothetical protein
VHHPTDLNLLYDAVRRVIETAAALCAGENFSDWRQSAHNIRCMERLDRRLHQFKRSNATDPEKRATRIALIEELCKACLQLAQSLLGFLLNTQTLNTTDLRPGAEQLRAAEGS